MTIPTLFSNSPPLFNYLLKKDLAGNITLAPLLEQMPDKAKALTDVLKTPAVQKAIKDYNEDNTKANRLQNQYLRARRASYWAAFIATLIGVLFLFPFMEWLNAPLAKVILLIIEASCIITIWVSRKNSTAKQKEYFDTRFKSEAHRLNLFVRVINNAPKQVLAAALDFATQYLFLDQRDYYQGRGRQHERNLAQASKWRWRARLIYKLLLGLTLPAVLLLAVKMNWLSFPWLEQYIKEQSWLLLLANKADGALAGMGVLVSAVHSLTVSLSRLELAERNTATYAEMVNELTNKLTALEGIQASAAAGEKDTVCGFTDDIIKRLRDEQEEWRKLQKVIMTEFRAEEG